MIIQADALNMPLADCSVDAIVTDPPYGLEFMGKEWDRLEPNRNTQRWKGTERKLIGDGRGKGGNFAERFNEMPHFMPKRNPKCRICNHYKFSGTPCKCESPDFDFRANEHNHFQYLWHTQWLTEAYRVLKPGGSMLVMGGTRTFHRLMCAIEDTGFIIKDTLMWIYGSGFPKAQEASVLVDAKILGISTKEVNEKRKKIGSIPARMPQCQARGWGNPGVDNWRDAHKGTVDMPITLPLTPEGEHWNGFKIGGIKPAYEPIVWAVKPPEGSYVDNVLKWGVGAVNVDECRISYQDTYDKSQAIPQGRATSKIGNLAGKTQNPETERNEFQPQQKGRFPANIILDEESARIMDEQSGEKKATPGGMTKFGGIFGGSPEHIVKSDAIYTDNGGASRFFYCAKASRSERNAGLDDLKNGHPTVKPIKLFEWLIKLVTREGQTVLDPFLGSGTTAISAHNTGRKCIGIEKEGEYIEIAKRRVEYHESQPTQMEMRI